MRRVLAVMLAVCMMCVMSMAVFAEDEYDPPIIEEFPAYGRCIGDNVRYRSGPGTNYKILGKINEDDEVLVHSLRRDSEGSVWYKIDDPKGKKRTVWIAGWYIEPLD